MQITLGVYKYFNRYSNSSHYETLEDQQLRLVFYNRLRISTLIFVLHFLELEIFAINTYIIKYSFIVTLIQCTIQYHYLKSRN